MFLRRGGLRSAKRPIESPVRGPDVPTFLDRVAALPPRVRDGMSMVSIHQIRSATRMAKIDHMSPAVAECAVIGVADDIKGQVPRALVVLKRGASADGLAEELIAGVRNEIGAVACFKQVDVVPALPKTRSGKILRKTMRDITQGKDVPMPSTIEDPKVLHLIRPILQP